MSILTPFFNLIKPAKNDGVKVADFNANMDTIDTEMHRPPLTVNGFLPNDARNINIESVPLADNLTSDEAQFVSGEFLVRTSGGGASISDGDASLSTIKGAQVKNGYVAEVIDKTVNAVPRVAPPEITAELDIDTFEAYVETAGTYTLTYTTEWSADPTDYGVTVSNTPVSGDSIVIVWDGENDREMTVNAVVRPVPASITATIDKAVFRAYVANSGTVTLSYTSSWSANPALYGITVNNTPVSGDSIVVEYVKENRGIITTANVSSFNSTGWNLYDDATDMARVVKYSDDYGYKVGGSYSLLMFATTPDGETSNVNVQNGYFNVPSDGYIIVTGGNSTTYIYPTWSDWTEGYDGDFETYTVDTIDLSGIMASFTAGLCAIGDVRDEINFNVQKAYSRIERMQYTSENLAAAIASGRAYDTDTNYIYIVRATPIEISFSVSGDYTVDDHGIEFFTYTSDVAPITDCLYGENLKDKLRSDVVTISGGLVNNLSSTATNKALTAAQGKKLNDTTVKNNSAGQWINGGTSSTKVGVANNGTNQNAYMSADGNGGNFQTRKGNAWAQFDSANLADDGTGYARILTNYTDGTQKVFQFKQDGDFVNGNGVSLDKLGKLVFAKGGTNTTTGQFSFTLPVGAAGVVVMGGQPPMTIGMTGSGVYNSSVPTGYSISSSGTTVTITKTSSVGTSVSVACIAVLA